MRLMLSASASSSRSWCVAADPRDEGGTGEAGSASSISSGFSASGTSSEAEATLFFPVFKESPKHAALLPLVAPSCFERATRRARATCSATPRPRVIFMQGIGAARGERNGNASRAPPATRRSGL